MKILFRAHSPCIRTYKEAKALRSLGLEVILASSGKSIEDRYPGLRTEDAFSEVWDAASIYAPHFVEDQGVDIIHTAHPPDNHVRDLLGCGVPIAHDFHDLYSLERTGAYHLRTEKDAARFASGLVFVSDGMAEYVEEKYPHSAMISCVIGNAADECTVVPRPKPWPADEIHVVYIAAMPRWGEEHYKDIQGLVKQITGQRIHFHVYAIIVKPELRQAASENPFLHLEDPVSGREKIELLSRFDAAVWSARSGLPPKMQVHIDLCCPNKMYEYWQAGIPMICRGGKGMRRFVAEYKMGWMVSDFSDLRSVLEQEYKPTRDVITMKEEVGKLIEFYEEII